MVQWLVPVCLFATLSALFLGGFPIRFQGGGGPRELVGLLLSFGLYLVLWGALRAALTTPLGAAAGLIVPSAAASLAIPGICWAGFRMAGVRIRRAPRAPHAGEGGAHA